MHRQLPWTVGNFVILTLIGTLQLSAQNTARIERLNAALDAIVAPETAIEKVASGFQFTEGPVWDRAGFLFFTDVNAAVINQWFPDGRVVRFRGPVEFTEKDLAEAGMPGPNGLTIDREGRLVACDQAIASSLEWKRMEKSRCLRTAIRVKGSTARTILFISRMAPSTLLIRPMGLRKRISTRKKSSLSTESIASRTEE